MILSRKCRSLSTTLPFAIYYGMRGLGLGLDSENNNICICITSGAAEIKKSRKRILIFFLICPNLESAGLRNYLSKNSYLTHVSGPLIPILDYSY